MPIEKVNLELIETTQPLNWMGLGVNVEGSSSDGASSTMP
ncbi:unnamed protein product [marine sediment metagenome]|uniref:Uncharacterized protein n=1 Tax=marine sediment metagenome TaxID=412755 RepID=X1UNN9_9ZZZZ